MTGEFNLSESMTALAFTTALFIVGLVSSEIGRRIGRARLARRAEGAELGLGVPGADWSACTWSACSPL